MTCCCYIDDHLFTEILIRSSATTLARCKCVNKRLNSLISDPHFINRHSSRPNSVQGLYHCSIAKSTSKIYLLPFDDNSSSSLSDIPERLFADDDNNQASRIILASCSGLLLIQFLDKAEQKNYYYLCNPTTKKHLCIPKLTLQEQLPIPSMIDDKSSSLGLCIIESSSSSSCNYKLVFVYYDDDHSSCNYKFIIFSKETGHWKHSEETISCVYSQLVNSSNSVYFRGALHWLREKGDILAFHVQKEQARMIQRPENINTQKRPGYQDTWFGVAAQDDDLLLNMVSISVNQVVIWALEDYQNIKWQIKKRIETADWIDLRTSSPKYFDGEQLVIVQKNTISLDAHIYNIRTGERNTKKLQLWLDSCRVFVPCTNNLIEL